MNQYKLNQLNFFSTIVLQPSLCFHNHCYPPNHYYPFQYHHHHPQFHKLCFVSGQFSPDITPLILAAHYNNHEMIQMFLSRNHIIEKPHPVTCMCEDCVTKRSYDSLKRSRSRWVGVLGGGGWLLGF